MENVTYRQLSLDDCERINEMNPTQYVGNAWREVNGTRQLVEINYLDADWPNGYEEHYNSLRKTISGVGSAIGAFDSENKLLGFATVDRQLFGKKHNYVLLDQLFITLEHRNKGIGKKLFMLSADVVKAWGADRFYICAGSAEETIKFYFTIGCREVEEIDEDLYKNDPRDFQLEFVL
jgi:GNAT superfamily N-acetyltransferase